MTDDLRTHIKQAIDRAHASSKPHSTYDDWLTFAADAVIAELGLKSQWINDDGIISDGPPPNWVLPCDIRYTTKWERSE